MKVFWFIYERNNGFYWFALSQATINGQFGFRSEIFTKTIISCLSNWSAPDKVSYFHLYLNREILQKIFIRYLCFFAFARWILLLGICPGR